MVNDPACAGFDNVTFSPRCGGEVFLCPKLQALLPER